MDTRIVTAKVDNDGTLRIQLSLGVEQAGQDVQVTVEPRLERRRTMCASDLLNSGLVGIWADRTEISDSRDFARRLREQAQNRSHSR